jgi:hypothetical protein
MAGGEGDKAPVVTQKAVPVKPAGGARVKPDVPQCDKYDWDALYDGLRSIRDMQALLAALHAWPVEALAYLYSPHLKDTRRMPEAERQRLRLAIHAVLYRKGERDEARNFQAELEAYTRGKWSDHHVAERAALTAYVHDDGLVYLTPDEYEGVTPAASGSATPLPKERFTFQYPGKTTHAVLTEFKQKVYEAHVKWHQSVGAKFHDLPKESLAGFAAAGIVGLHRKKPGGEWLALNYPQAERYSIQKDAANYLKDLFFNAGEDLKADVAAKSVTAIGVSNAYRSAETDFGIWSGMFFGTVLSVIPRKPGEDVKALWALANGKDSGPALVQRMADYYTAKPAEAIRRVVGEYQAGKAAPGFSKHSDGKAVDFTTTQGEELGPSDSQHQAWMNSWFFIWLAKHAKDFKFYPLSTEPWHWNFVP